MRFPMVVDFNPGIDPAVMCESRAAGREFSGAAARRPPNQWHVLRSLLSWLRAGHGPPSSACGASPEGYAQRREKWLHALGP